MNGVNLWAMLAAYAISIPASCWLMRHEAARPAGDPGAMSDPIMAWCWLTVLIGTPLSLAFDWAFF